MPFWSTFFGVLAYILRFFHVYKIQNGSIYYIKLLYKILIAEKIEIISRRKPFLHQLYMESFLLLLRNYNIACLFLAKKSR